MSSVPFRDTALVESLLTRLVFTQLLRAIQDSIGHSICCIVVNDTWMLINLKSASDLAVKSSRHLGSQSPKARSACQRMSNGMPQDCRWNEGVGMTFSPQPLTPNEQSNAFISSASSLGHFLTFVKDQIARMLHLR